MLMAAGAAMSLAFPRVSLWPLAWVGLVPLLVAIRRSRLRGALASGLSFGIGYYGALLYWITIFGYLPWILLALMQAIPIAFFSFGAAVIRRTHRPIFEFLAIPALWAALDWLRTLGAFGFSWGGLAYSQAPNLAAVQTASFAGPWGLTFAIVLVNAALAADRRSRLASLAIAAVVVAAIHSGGAWLLNREPAEGGKLTAALVQGSLDQDLELTPERGRKTMRIYETLTLQAAAAKPDFIVWPETVVPGDLERSPQMRHWVSVLARSSGAHMLVGSLHDQPAGQGRPPSQLNGAYMFSPSGNLIGRYYKVHLVPFGEFVPGRKWLPFLERYKVRDIDVRPGRSHNLIPSGHGPIGVMICFESIFPDIARRETRDGARMLFVITNDGWFRRTSAAAQHHDFSIFRAVENRRYVVRNAATGISSVIDPYGRIEDRLDIWRRGVVYGDVDALSGLTFYSRYGDWFAYLSAAVALCGITIWAFARARKRRRRPGSGSPY